MFNLLEIELRKLVPSRDFWLSMSAYVLLVPAAFLSLKLFSFEIPNSQLGVNLFAFPDVWQNVAYVAGWVGYLLYVIVLQTVTHEYQFRTIRQNIIDGLSPGQYLLGKVSLLVLFTLASMALISVLALLGGFLGAAHAQRIRILANAHYVLLYGLQLFGYLSMALLVGTLMRRTGTAILAFVGYTLIVEPLMRGLVLPAMIARYLPSHVLAGLVPNPFFGYVGMGGPVSIGWTTIALSSAYIVSFVLLAWRVVSTQDL